MADNAELRIVISDAGGPSGPGASIPSAAPPSLRPAAGSAEEAAPSSLPPAAGPPDLAAPGRGSGLPSFQVDAGPALQSLAGNRNFSALTEGATQAGKALSGIGLAGGPVGPILGEVVEAATSFKGVIDAFIDRGKELAQFSPELAAAAARAEVQSLQLDIEEARKLGPELARLTEAQTRADKELREFLLPVKVWITEKLAGIMEFIAENGKFIGAAVAAMRAAIEQIGKALEEFFDREPGLAVSRLGFIGAAMDRAFKQALAEHRQKQKEELADPTIDLFNGLDEALGNLPALRGLNIARVGARGGLNVPVFGGF